MTAAGTQQIADALVIRRGEGGVVRRIDSMASLDEAQGTLVKVGSKKVGDRWLPTYTPSATGFRSIGEASGIVTQQADTVTVDDKQQPNGYRDPVSGTIYYRCKAGGFTAHGIPAISDRTVSYNVTQYNQQDMLKKLKDGMPFLKLLPKALSAAKRMELIDEGWAPYPLDEAFEIWADGKSKELAEMLSAMKHRQIHADRTCQTFAERNAIAAHPAMPSGLKFSINKATIQCKMWYCPEGGIRWDASRLDIEKQLMEASGGKLEKVVGVDSLTEQAEKDGEIHTAIDAEARASADLPGEAGDDAGDDAAEQQVHSQPVIPKPDANEQQRKELLKAIEGLAQGRSVTFAKVLKSLNLTPADWIKAPIAALLDVDKLMKTAMAEKGIGK